MDQLVVLKFGGTSVGESDARSRVLAIVQAERRPSVIVVSALAGVTDELLQVAGAGGSREGARRLQALLDRHLDAAGAVRDEQARVALERELRQDAANVADALAVGTRSAAVLRDSVVAVGELWSSRLLAALLRASGTPAEWVDARQVLHTNDQQGTAVPDLAATAAAVARLLRPAVAGGHVPVIGGFIGSGASGRTTTLGRGGSDYSAAILGVCLDAAEIQIWTDVDGVLTADPRLLPHARVVPHLSYGEAHDLAAFGAKVLHPGTISPAVERRIPVLVRNSHRPSAPGTRVSGDRRAPGRAVAGLASRSGVSLVEVISRPGQGMALGGQIREALREFRLEPVLAEDRGERLILSFHGIVGSSTLSDGGAASLPGDVLRNRLSEVADVVVQHSLAMIVIVGEDLAAHGTVAGEAASALHGVPVRLTGRPTGGRSLAFVLDEAYVPTAMHRLHERFFGAGAHTPSMSCHAVVA